MLIFYSQHNKVDNDVPAPPSQLMDVNTFIKAAENGDLQKVKEYIDGGDDVNAEDKVSWT